jgi:hypothetical protein
MFALVMCHRHRLRGRADRPHRSGDRREADPRAVPHEARPVPAWALNSIAPDADVFTLAKTALAEIEQRIQYETQLIAAVAACQ